MAQFTWEVYFKISCNRDLHFQLKRGTHKRGEVNVPPSEGLPSLSLLFLIIVLAPIMEVSQERIS